MTPGYLLRCRCLDADYILPRLTSIFHGVLNHTRPFDARCCATFLPFILCPQTDHMERVAEDGSSGQVSIAIPR